MDLDRVKRCNICGDELPITDFSKRGKQRWTSFCKKCKPLRNEMMKAKKNEIPTLKHGVEIEVRGKVSKRSWLYIFCPL